MRVTSSPMVRSVLSRDAKRRSAGAGSNMSPSARIFEMVEDRLARASALVQGRLDTLIEALRHFGHPVADFRGPILKDVSDAARAGSEGTRHQVERMSAGMGNLPNAQGLIINVDRSTAEELAEAARRLALEEQDDASKTSKLRRRSWSEMDPGDFCEFEGVATKKVFLADIVMAAAESSAAAPLAMVFVDVDD